ncbi:hypothetical protein RI103_09325 [Paraburkholderia sp. FT54]|uniref:hypothetical protein n=1 Tax=Paraburkholderia sp. FT54 TaxID=3074437 RepID=UPI002877759E|nr:hypothetical protein [Paraburkholderia sp. FT54]WNC91524.1 hypothetical protein RI103_09325 [Paraburkholderia sp. FT54]
MGGTELKRDASHRYTLYRTDRAFMPFASRDDQHRAVDEGKRFTLAAYADAWAKDAGLVKRVRTFLHRNFYWHDRLAKNGSALDVVRTLQDMVRGDSVVVIPERLTGTASVMRSQRNPASPFWGTVDGDEKPFVSIADRYRAQLEQMNADPLTWAEIRALQDGINVDFMQAMFQTVPVASAVIFSKAGWISKYGVPDLSEAGPVDTIATSRSAFGGARPFEFGDGRLPAGTMALAGIPFDGEPNAWAESAPGKKKQWRMYGPDGAPVVDIDFDNHHGQPNPHAHNWDDWGRDHGWPVSVLP